MGNIIISGASDDLVEIGGLISDEFTAYDVAAEVTIRVDDTVHLIATAEYDRDNDGEWRVEVAGSFPDAQVIWRKAFGEDFADRWDEDSVVNYSDKLVVDMGDVAASRISVSAKEARSRA